MKELSQVDYIYKYFKKDFFKENRESLEIR